MGRNLQALFDFKGDNFEESFDLNFTVRRGRGGGGRRRVGEGDLLVLGESVNACIHSAHFYVYL